MKLPRDLSGRDLVQALGSLGYKVTRQSGSHLRLTTDEHGEHHVTISNHEWRPLLALGRLDQPFQGIKGRGLYSIPNRNRCPRGNFSTAGISHNTN